MSVINPPNPADSVVVNSSTVVRELGRDGSSRSGVEAQLEGSILAVAVVEAKLHLAVSCQGNTLRLLDSSQEWHRVGSFLDKLSPRKQGRRCPPSWCRGEGIVESLSPQNRSSPAVGVGAAGDVTPSVLDWGACGISAQRPY